MLMSLAVFSIPSRRGLGPDRFRFTSDRVLGVHTLRVQSLHELELKASIRKLVLPIKDYAPHEFLFGLLLFFKLFVWRRSLSSSPPISLLLFFSPHLSSSLLLFFSSSLLLSRALENNFSTTFLVRHPMVCFKKRVG